MAGYHLKPIFKGILGEFSKIEEEFNEFIDAHEQSCALMGLIELSDLLGSIKHYFAAQQQIVYWDNSLHAISQTSYNKDLWHKTFGPLSKSQSLPDIICSYDELLSLFNRIKLEQNNYVLLTHLLIDINRYVKQYNMNIFDLIKMNDITERAFTSGERTT